LDDDFMNEINHFFENSLSKWFNILG
jgi:hypothetical protein